MLPLFKYQFGTPQIEENYDDYTYDPDVEEEENSWAKYWKIANDETKSAGSFMAPLSQLAMSGANAPGFRPNVAMGIGAGALQGAAVGGIPGALIGAGMAGFTTARNASAYDNLRQLYEKQQHENKKVSQDLGYYAQFGGETPGDVMAQTEYGEVVLFPDNTLPNVKAKKKHSNMSDEKVTDILPEGSYVFSDDKNMKFNVKDVKDKVIGYGMSHYDEHTDYDTEEMLLGDFLPKKGKLTFAAAAKTLRNKIKTVGDSNDILNLATDTDNLETRVPYLMELISLQDQKNMESGRMGSTIGGEGEMEEQMPEEFQFGTFGKDKFVLRKYGTPPAPPKFGNKWQIVE